MILRLTLLLLLGLFCSVDSAVVGIDFASGFIKVALVRPGAPFHIVEDETSKRKYPNSIAFAKGERRFGNQAKSLLVRFPDTSFEYVSRLLMKTPDSEAVQTFQKEYRNFDFVEMDGRGVVGVTVGEDVYSIDELLAMILEYSQHLAEKDSPDSAVKDCVMTVPSSYTQIQRQALLDAADLAGWNVLNLLNENSAAAVQYGIDLDYDAEKVENVIFYNMGARTTEVSLVRYSGYIKSKSRKTNSTIGQGEVLATVSDDNLGGALFDAAIVDHLLAEAQENFPDLDLSTIPRVTAKLRQAAIKAKTVLSANNEAHIYVESLYKDFDFRTQIKRTTFLEFVDSLVERSLAPLTTICEENDVDPSEIEVILVGGGARIPAIQAGMREFIGGRDLKMNLDGDEAMAMGAVFRAANLSTTFRPRPFGLIDITRYPIDVDIYDTAEEGQSEDEVFRKHASIFQVSNKLGKKKSVALTHTTDFMVDVMHADPEILPQGISPLIDTYAISGVEKIMTNPKYEELLVDQEPRVSLSFLLDNSGIVSIVKAEATLDEMIQVPVKKSKKKKKDSETDTDKSDDAAEGEEDTSADPPVVDETSEDTVDTTVEPEEEEEEFELKKKTHKIPLKVTILDLEDAPLKLLNKAQKKAIRKRMKDFTARTLLKQELSKAKNDLESHIYRTRSSTYADFDEVSTEEQRDAIIEALMEAEDWLFDQSDDVTQENIQTHTSKITELQKLSNPIYYRLSELEARPQAVENAQDMFSKAYDLVVRLSEERPWLPGRDIEKLFNMTRDAETELNESLELQAALQMHEPPAMSSQRIIRSLQPIAKFSQELLKRKEPPPPVEKKEKKKKNQKKKKSDEEAQEEDETAEGASEEEQAPVDAEETAEQQEQQEDEEVVSEEEQPGHDEL